MDSRFNRQKANLRSYLRKRGAEIDVKHKTVRVDVDSLNRKEVGRLRELERWGYKVNERKNSPPPKHAPEEYEFEDDSFIAFADEIMEQYF
jgi:hypothetical protein